MGGNALSIETRRLSKDEYGQLAADVKAKLEEDKYLCIGRIEVFKSYGDKKSFGDIDILMTKTALSTMQITHRITEVFSTKEVVHNDNTYSFAYEGAQVDLKFVAPHLFDVAFNYYAYNDLGGLLGRLAAHQGFTLGPQGLLYKLMRGTRLIDTLTITRDWVQILRILQIEDVNAYDTGFDSLESMFELVASSAVFDPALYMPANRSAKKFSRDKGRKTYTEFIRWLDYCRPSTGILTKKGKDFWLADVLSKYPYFKVSYNIAVAEYEKQLFIKNKFNGTTISEATGITGKELGTFISWFNIKVSQDELIASIKSDSCVYVIKTFYELFKLIQDEEKTST